MPDQQLAPHVADGYEQTVGQVDEMPLTETDVDVNTEIGAAFGVCRRECITSK